MHGKLIRFHVYVDFSLWKRQRLKHRPSMYIIFRLFKGFIHRTNSIMSTKITCSVNFALTRQSRGAGGSFQKTSADIVSLLKHTALALKFVVIRHVHVSPFWSSSPDNNFHSSSKLAPVKRILLAMYIVQRI